MAEMEREIDRLQSRLDEHCARRTGWKRREGRIRIGGGVHELRIVEAERQRAVELGEIEREGREEESRRCAELRAKVEQLERACDELRVCARQADERATEAEEEVANMTAELRLERQSALAAVEAEQKQREEGGAARRQLDAASKAVEEERQRRKEAVQARVAAEAKASEMVFGAAASAAGERSAAREDGAQGPAGGARADQEPAAEDGFAGGEPYGSPVGGIGATPARGIRCSCLA